MPVSTSKAITLGLIAGLVGGLFGVGGGIIVIPGLVLWLNFSQHKASGTSIAAIIASTAAGLVSFAGDGSVDWRVAALITSGAVVGASIGTRVIHLIPATTLRKAFSVLMLIAAARMAIT